MDRQKRLERLQLISSLFDAAIEKPPKKWDAFLDVACPDDADARRKVKELLHSFQGPVNPLKPAGTDLYLDASPQDQPFTLVGRQVGPYWLKRVVSSGEGGVAYDALHTKTNQDVRVLVLPPEVVAQRDVMAQLRQDTARLNTLNEPCFPHVLELKKTPEHTLLVTAPMTGETLADRIAAEAPLAWEEALPLFIALLKVIRKAHQAGVVHRALSPAVVYLDQDTKSGLSIGGFRPFAPPSAETTGSIDPGTGAALQYFAPEYFEGLDAVDEGSDQYSLGVIFYELLAGALPLDPYCTGAEAHRFITTHQLTEPDTFDLDVPEDLAAIVQRTLAGDPTKRYRNLGRLLKALKAFNEAYAPPEPTAPWVELPAAETETESEPTPDLVPAEPAFGSGDSLPQVQHPETPAHPAEPPVPVLAEADTTPKRTGPKVARIKRPKAAAQDAAPSLSAQRRLAPAPLADAAPANPAHDQARRRWAIVALLFALFVVLFAIGLQLSKGQSQPLTARATPYIIATPDPITPASTRPPTTSAPVRVVEQTNPEPIGGYGVIQREIQYPAAVPDRTVSGTVIVELTVDATGAVHDPKVVQGLAAPFDQEAMRVLQRTRFRPALQGKTPVAATIRLPIQFSP